MRNVCAWFFELLGHLWPDKTDKKMSVMFELIRFKPRVCREINMITYCL